MEKGLFDPLSNIEWVSFNKLQDHKKNCQFSNCSCGQCELIDTRRALDSHIKKGRKRNHIDDG